MFLFLLKWPWDAESGQKAILTLNLQEKWSCCTLCCTLCCTCVAHVLHMCCTSVAWKFPINCVDHVKTCQDTSLKPRKRKTDTRPYTCSVPKDIYRMLSQLGPVKFYANATVTVDRQSDFNTSLKPRKRKTKHIYMLGAKRHTAYSRN